MIALSKNCDEYTDHASSQINVKAIHKDADKCFINTTIMSCQEGQFERPDKATAESIQDLISSLSEKNDLCTGLDATRFDITTHSVILGAKTTELSGKDLHERRMASNCADGFDLGKINSHNHYTCRNFGEMEKSDGTKVRNYHMKFSGILPSCEKDITLSNQTDEDIRKLVKYRAGEEGLKMNLEDIACDIFGAPV
jgi:hypothetical protein